MFLMKKNRKNICISFIKNSAIYYTEGIIVTEKLFNLEGAIIFKILLEAVIVIIKLINIKY